MVGLPPEPEHVPTAAPPADPPVADTPEPVVAKRGRPPKSDRPMTAAERKRQERARKAEKAADVQRRDLVAQLVKINRRGLSKAYLESPQGRAQANAVLANNRIRMQKMRDEWVSLPLEELQKALKTYEEIKDSTGRMHGESSGELGRTDGTSHVEKIIAAAENQQHSGHDDAAGTGKGGDVVQNYNTESGTTGETAGRPPRGLRIPKEHTDYLDRREAIIKDLIAKHTKREADGVRCLLCYEIKYIDNTDGTKSGVRNYPVLIPDASDVRQHFWREYDKGLEMFYRWQELIEGAGVAEQAQFLVDDARRAYQNSNHLQAVWRESQARK
jgi:hypothetical protein